MHKKSYNDTMLVARFLDESGATSLTPAILHELGLPSTSNYCHQMKKWLGDMGLYQTHKFYIAKKVCQTISPIKYGRKVTIDDNASNELKVLQIIKEAHEFDTAIIHDRMPIMKSQLSVILSKMVKNGEVEIVANEKAKQYRFLEEKKNHPDFLAAYLRSLHNQVYCHHNGSHLPKHMEKTRGARKYKYETLQNIEDVYRNTVEDTENNEDDRDIDSVTESLSDVSNKRFDVETLNELQELEQRYHNQLGRQQFRTKFSYKALKEFCEQQIVSIDRQYQTKVNAINDFYQSRFKTDFFCLRFRFNYSFKQSKKQCSIKKSTRMSHPKWYGLRNKEKVVDPSLYDCRFIQDEIRKYLGNYQEYDIRSAVPRITARINGIRYDADTDIYKLIIDKAIEFDDSWSFYYTDEKKYRNQIKTLFMIFYFTGNVANKVRYSTVNNMNEKELEKARIIRNLAKDEEQAEKLIASEVSLFDDKIIAQLYSLSSCEAFADAISAVIGKGYHKEIFYIESLIELDVVHHFISQGKVVVNNFDGFFMEDTIDIDEFKDILDAFIDKHAMEYRNLIPAKKYAPRNIEKQMIEMLRQPA